MTIGSVLGQPLAINSLGEKSAAVDHERRTSGHVRGQHAGYHESEPTWKQQMAASETERVLGVTQSVCSETPLNDHGRCYQSHHGPTHRTETFDVVAIEHAFTAGLFVFSCP